MEISLKTGIEHRFSSSKFKSTVKLHILMGKLRNFMEFSHGSFKYGLIQFQMDVFLVYNEQFAKICIRDRSLITGGGGTVGVKRGAT